MAPIIAIAKIGELPSGASLSARCFIAQPLRIEYPEVIYHNTSRGSEKVEEAVKISGIMRERKGLLTK